MSHHVENNPASNQWENNVRDREGTWENSTQPKLKVKRKHTKERGESQCPKPNWNSFNIVVNVQGSKMQRQSTCVCMHGLRKPRRQVYNETAPKTLTLIIV